MTTAKLEKVRAAAGRLDSNEARTSNKRKLVIAENRLNKTLVRLNQAVSKSALKFSTVHWTQPLHCFAPGESQPKTAAQHQ